MAVASSATSLDTQTQTSNETASLLDLRYRALLGDEAWGRLPPPVQRRFSKKVRPGGMTLYRGTVTDTKLSWAGRLLAFLTIPLGSPLPSARNSSGPALVAVTDDQNLGGQRWTRIYDRAGRRPQMIQSTKRFRGQTGLEEYVGLGLSMQLALRVSQTGVLEFHSARYLVQAGPIRFAIPNALAPGKMTITHEHLEDGSFAFNLSLRHPWLGELISQRAIFRDVDRG